MEHYLTIWFNTRNLYWSTAEQGGLPIIRIQNLNDRAAEFNYFNGEYDAKYEVHRGDLLFSWSGSRGSSFGAHIWNGSTAILNQHIFRVEFSPSLNKHYLYYALNQAVSTVEQRLHGGVGLVHITKGDLEAITIPVPPLTVQEEIVAEIESYQRIIDGARQVVENYKPTIKIDPAWEKKAIGEVCKTASGGTPTSTNRAYYENGTINWLKSGEVSKGFIYSTEEHITEKALQESAAKLFPVDTVVIAMYGATAGQVGILKTESTTNQAICGIYPNEYYLPEFIYFYLKSKRDYFLSQSTGGAQPNISQLTIKKTMIPSVPIEQQRVIVDAIREEMSIVEQNKRLIEIFQQKIKDKIAEVWGE